MRAWNCKADSIRVRRRDRRSGYMLVATSLSLFFLLGVAGLAIDVGRMYITKSEAQAFADSAALSAASKLDGTSSGITNATSSATSDNDKWRFDTTKFTSVGVSFSNSSTGSFVSSPADPSTAKFVQVYVSVNLPMYLIRVFSGPSASVSASAIAGQSSITTLNGGVFPFAPYSRSSSVQVSGQHAIPDDTTGTDPYGYVVGDQYTLRWGAPGTSTNCGTDSSATEPLAGSVQKVRGYCCVSNSAASIRQAIVGLNTDSVTIGSTIVMDNGEKQTEMTGIADRVALDSDTTSTTYSAYKSGGTGNGARVVVVPVISAVDGSSNATVAGLAAFFLLDESYYSGLQGGNNSACAEYIGPWTQGVTFPQQPSSNSVTNAYKLRLFR